MESVLEDAVSLCTSAAVLGAEPALHCDAVARRQHSSVEQGFCHLEIEELQSCCRRRADDLNLTPGCLALPNARRLHRHSRGSSEWLELAADSVHAWAEWRAVVNRGCSGGARERQEDEHARR